MPFKHITYYVYNITNISQWRHDDEPLFLLILVKICRVPIPNTCLVLFIFLGLSWVKKESHLPKFTHERRPDFQQRTNYCNSDLSFRRNESVSFEFLLRRPSVQKNRKTLYNHRSTIHVLISEMASIPSEEKTYKDR